jgi:Mor family transcriptional regulator
MNILGLLTAAPKAEIYCIIGAAVITGLTFVGIKTYHHGYDSGYKVAHDEMIQLELNYNKQSLLVSQLNQAESTRRDNEIQSKVNDAEQKTKQAKADAVAANSAADSLRKRFAAAASASCGGATFYTSTPSSSTTTYATDNLLSDVFGRVTDAAQQIATYADSAHNAGQLAADSYSSLKTSEKK